MAYGKAGKFFHVGNPVGAAKGSRTSHSHPNVKSRRMGGVPLGEGVLEDEPVLDSGYGERILAREQDEEYADLEGADSAPTGQGSGRTRRRSEIRRNAT